MKRRTLLSLMAAAPVSSALTACGGGSDSGVSLRLLNASAGYDSLDLYVDDDVEVSAVAFGEVSSFADTGSTDFTTTLKRASSSTSLLAQTRSLDSGSDYTLVAYGWEGSLKSILITEDEDDADSGEAKVNVLHTAPDAGSIDVYLTADDDSLDDATPIASSLAGAASSAYSAVTAGSFRLRITAAGDTTDVRLDVTGLALTSEQVATVVVTPGGSGVLVNALLLVQGGAVTAFMNTQARVRVVAATTDNAVVSATADGASLGATARSSTIGSYTLMTAGTAVAVVVTVAGSSYTSSQAITAGSDVTLLVYGEATAPLMQLLADDNRLPTDTTKFKIRLVHALARLDANLTLTLDYSAVASEVVYGTSSAFSSVTANSAAQISVTSALSSTPLYSATDVSLVAKGIYTFFMMGAADASTLAGVLRMDR